MTENASNSFSRKNEKKMLVFPKNAEKNASTIEKGLLAIKLNFKILKVAIPWQIMADTTLMNRLFTQSGVRNKLFWDAKNTVQWQFQNEGKSGWTGKSFFFGSPIALLASQHNLFPTMWPDRAKESTVDSWWIDWKSKAYTSFVPCLNVQYYV